MGNILVYCNVDDIGNFTEIILGRKIIPDRDYQYFFITEDTGILTSPNNYKVDVNTRQLVLK